MIDKVGSVFNLRKSISDSQQESDNIRRDGADKGTIAVKYMESYAYLVCLNGYLHDRYEVLRKNSFSGSTPVESFRDWLSNRGELALALEAISKHPERSLKIATLSLDSKHAEVFEMRDWSVLVRGSILKIDHFPGCRSKRIKEIVKGSTNFRMLDQVKYCTTHTHAQRRGGERKYNESLLS